MLDRIRTKHFPIVFALTGLLFVALFSLFYLFIFDSIQKILIQQNARIISDLKEIIVDKQFEFERQSKILRLSRLVQRNLAGGNEIGPQSETITVLNKFATSWHKQVKDEIYESLMYLDVDYNPIAGVDFVNDGKTTGLAESTLSQKSDNTEGKSAETAAKISESLLVRWDGDHQVVAGTYAQILTDTTQVLRTVLEIKNRRNKALMGYVGIDRKLNDVISWQRDPARDLLIYNAGTGQIIFDSADVGRSGGSIEKHYPALLHALAITEAENGIEAAKYIRNKKDFLVTAMSIDEIGWVLASNVYLDPLLEDSEYRGSILIVVSVLFVGLMGLSINALTSRVQRRTEELEKANEIVTAHTEMLEDELQTAHDMQMRLMPQEHPIVPGFDISGRCRPATQVGGDFFQYFTLPDSRLAITLADVTGHGMEAAIPTMVFSGLLDNQIEYTPAPDELMSRLNTSLNRVLERRTFICFSMGELDPETRHFRLSNGGCPYPYLFRAASGEIEEVSLSAFPLGLRPEATYTTMEKTLEEGDMVVFCSDGIIEAGNAVGEIYGFERTADCIRRGGQSKASAEAIIQQLFDEVDAFVGNGIQDDDQTVVVLCCVET